MKQIEVTLRNKAGKTELITRDDVDVMEVLGGKFADAGTKLCRQLEIAGGVQVVGIKPDGILARARVKEGLVTSRQGPSIDGVYPNGRAASYLLVE